MGRGGPSRRRPARRRLGDPRLARRADRQVETAGRVLGHNDGPELRSRLPERADVVLDGLRCTVTHETGGSAGRDARMSRRYPDTDVLVFGHSHIPWDTTTGTGLRLLNPGSPTDRRRQPFCTYMTTSIANGVLGDVVLHRLEK